ncbi:hypothetical protein HF888_07740 [Bermanella marisrubri]|uniref:Uncharacterized protein n=1 Tax=Bermanella marisrubri TaxID=207949 RepID=Q1N4Q9_9GAMM|nr:hypothetical protein [Bermanella marisrubri]EAT13369.1 hypothetical protein RED65_01375 [Oceanobacter sp. RED65] [Bermanella marisrubri]QIZ84124.1 hypothetical protein HF888_07740 [Bermanella marisrubri]
MARECGCSKAFEEKIRLKADRLKMKADNAKRKAVAGQALDQLVGYVHGLDDLSRLTNEYRDLAIEIRGVQIEVFEQFKARWND